MTLEAIREIHFMPWLLSKTANNNIELYTHTSSVCNYRCLTPFQPLEMFISKPPSMSDSHQHVEAVAMCGYDQSALALSQPFLSPASSIPV